MADYDGKNGHEFYDTSCELNVMMKIKMTRQMIMMMKVMLSLASNVLLSGPP